MEQLEDKLLHYGVKGMKWGVRKSSQNGNKKSNKVVAKVKAEANSLSRERKWKKVLKDIDKMSTKDINDASFRIGIENELRNLSKKEGVGSKKDKNDYLNRANMDNGEVVRKVVRLRAKDSLNRQVKEASKNQTDLGKRVVSTASKIGVSYVTGQKLSPDDIIKSYKSDPETAIERSANDAVNAFTNRSRN